MKKWAERDGSVKAWGWGGGCRERLRVRSVDKSAFAASKHAAGRGGEVISTPRRGGEVISTPRYKTQENGE